MFLFVHFLLCVRVVVFFRENVKTKQVMHALALEEMLTSVQVILDEQFDTTTILRTSIMAQMQTFNGQVNPFAF